MRVRLRLTLNIGTRDAGLLNLSATRSGEIVEVSQEVADHLIRKAWGVPIDAPAPAATPQPDPAPPEPESEPDDGDTSEIRAESDDDGLEDMTKLELKSYAADHGIAGVGMSMSKAEMIEAIRRGREEVGR